MTHATEQNFPLNIAALLMIIVFVFALSQALSPASLVVGLHLFAAALCLGSPPAESGNLI